MGNCLPRAGSALAVSMGISLVGAGVTPHGSPEEALLAPLPSPRPLPGHPSWLLGWGWPVSCSLVLSADQAAMVSMHPVSTQTEGPWRERTGGEGPEGLGYSPWG